MIKQKLVETEHSSLSGAVPAFDGRKNIYSPVEFQEDRLEFLANLPISSCNTQIKCGDLRQKLPRKKIDKLFRDNMRLVSKFDWKEQREEVDGKEQRKEVEIWAPLPREYIHALEGESNREVYIAWNIFIIKYCINWTPHYLFLRKL